MTLPRGRLEGRLLRRDASGLVDFFLRFAGNDERNGLSEFEVWTAVQGHKVLSIQLELRDHYRSLWSWPGITIATTTQDF